MQNLINLFEGEGGQVIVSTEIDDGEDFLDFFKNGSFEIDRIKIFFATNWEMIVARIKMVRL